MEQLQNHLQQGMDVYICRDAIDRVPHRVSTHHAGRDQSRPYRIAIHHDVPPGISMNQPGRDQARPYNPSTYPFINIHPPSQAGRDSSRPYNPSTHSFVNIHRSLPNTPLWEPRPPMESYSSHPPTITQHAQLLAHLLQTHGKQEGLAPLASLLLAQTPPETPLIRMALPMLRILIEATWKQDIEQLQTATRGLAGLGPGLTPSGDDVLGGFIAALTLLSEHISSDTASRKHLAETIVYMAIGRTTKFSATLLAHAARGEVAEHLGELIIVLSFDDNQRLLQAANRLLSFGATSGGDTLLGLLLGIHALLNKTM